jgi:hypothetical protein
MFWPIWPSSGVKMFCWGNCCFCCCCCYISPRMCMYVVVGASSFLDTQRSPLKKEDAPTTTYVRIRGDIQQQQFPQQNILTLDDGHIGRIVALKTVVIRFIINFKATVTTYTTCFHIRILLF